ncbi:MAG: hypothetical protein H0X18_02160 [Geodermatophilaceae bacterium]|nr:hypothetical protein [Geodermatophilaceae bacterium]
MPQLLSGSNSLPGHESAAPPLRRSSFGRRLTETTGWTPAQDWRRLLDAIRQGLITHSAAAVARDQHAASNALRCRQCRPRRIALVGSNGGVGTTTAAVLLASVLAAARDDHTLLLTVHSDASDAAARLAVPHAPSVTEVLAAMRRHGRIPPTPVTSSGLRVLSAPSPNAAAVDTGLSALLDVAAAGHASVVVDAGVASRIGDLTTLAGLFDTVVLVCAAAAHGVDSANAVMTRWRAELSPTTQSRLILAPVRIHAGGSSPGNDPLERLSAEPAATHVLAHDAELGRGRPIDLNLISGASLSAALLLGADIMGRR